MNTFISEEALEQSPPTNAPSRRRCLELLRDRGPHSLTAIARFLGVSRPTAEQVVTDLLADGIVSPGDPQAMTQGIGRPARIYGFRAGAGHVVGVDISPAGFRANVADLAGAVLGTATCARPDDMRGADAIALVDELIVAAARDASLALREIDLAVVAVPGIVDAQRRVAFSAPIPEWSGVDLGALLARRLEISVLLENDVNLAAIAEHRIGAAQLAEDVVLIMARERRTSARLNAGLIIGGHLHRGRHAVAGEIAEINLGSDHTDDINALAERIALINLVIDPDTVVLGGQLAHLSEQQMLALRAATAAVIPFQMQTTLVRSTLRDDVVLSGALILGIETVGNRLYGPIGVHAPRIFGMASSTSLVLTEETIDTSPLPSSIYEGKE